MNLWFKKKQRQSGTGGKPLELKNRVEETAAPVVDDLEELVRKIDKVLAETATTATNKVRDCCNAGGR